MSEKIGMHWFRKGLRLHDNPALLAASKDAKKMYPVFILDPTFGPGSVGPVRYSFLLESLRDLDNQFKAKGSRLFVVRGSPKDELPKLWEKWKVTFLSFEADTEPYARRRDEEVCKKAREMNIEVVQEHTHTLRPLDAYAAKLGGKPVTAYTQFQKVYSALKSPEKPIDAPSSFPQLSGAEKTNAEFDPPSSLEECGYDIDSSEYNLSKFPGGETEGLKRLRDHMKKKKWVAEFEKPKTPPTTLSPSTTVMSPYMKFGCVSVRKFWYELQQVYEDSSGHTHPPVSLHGQLLWREFFYWNGYSCANYDRMEGNPICRQIPWSRNREMIEKWKQGKTGYPWIDACMRQLKTEGWLHHLARHAVACFLTRGDLWQSWEEGAKIFDEYLIDADWSVNNGNWMWLSCSSFFYQYFRCYSPSSFPKKTDADGKWDNHIPPWKPTSEERLFVGKYIKKWIPELRKYPKQFIYEPWKAPLATQKSCGCIIGKDYPEPIVDHTTISKQNMNLIKTAYDAEKAGKSMPALKKLRTNLDHPHPIYEDDETSDRRSGTNEITNEGESAGSKRKR